MSHLDIVIRLALALVIGAVVGIDREKSRQSAGFRTHILVSVGACVASITSLLLFDEFHHIVNLDPGRISAQVLSGIGFLGAGAILKTANTIRGLTTAAGLWVVASVGLAVGFGFYYLSIMTLIFLMITLRTLKFFDGKIASNKVATFNISTDNVPQATTDLFTLCEKNRIRIKDIDKLQDEVGSGSIKLSVSSNNKYAFKDMKERIKKIKGITEVEYLN